MPTNAPNRHLTATDNQTAKTFVHTLEALNICGGIRNVDTQYQLIQIGEQLVPATLNDAEYHNSYVCSPYTAYISYAKDELGL